MRELLERKLASLHAEKERIAATNHDDEIEAKVAEYRQKLVDADAREKEAALHNLDMKCEVVKEMLAEVEAEAEKEMLADPEQPNEMPYDGGGDING